MYPNALFPVHFPVNSAPSAADYPLEAASALVSPLIIKTRAERNRIK